MIHLPPVKPFTLLLAILCALILTCQISFAAQILAGGFMDSALTVNGGNLTLLALCDPESTEVELFYEGLPTGAFLPSQGGYFALSTYASGPLPPQMIRGVEFVARNDGGDSSSPWPYLTVTERHQPYIIFLSASADTATRFAAGELQKYLGWMTKETVLIQELASTETEEALARRFDTAGFLVDPQQWDAAAYSEYSDLNAQWFLIEGEDLGGKGLYRIGGGNALGTFYGVYRFLHEHGVRYFQPEDEWVPDSFQPRLPLHLKEGPRFTTRGYHWHQTHPIEIISSTRSTDYDSNAAYTKRVTLYFIKMYANQGGLGVTAGPAGLPEDHPFVQRARDVAAFNGMFGFPHGSGISFHGTQQGGHPDVDWNSSVPVEDQITNFIDARMRADPLISTFSVGFGPTEYTTTPFAETLYYLDFATKYILDTYPGVLPLINSHITGNEYSDEVPGVSYRDLPVLTDPRVCVQWHTVMFYDLFSPAPCYGREDFTQKWDYMVQEANRPDGPRPQIYYPETGYWLSFDNSIPCFYPVYMYGRAIDMREVKELIPKGLFGYRTFSTGQEWGYWMQDYVTGQIQWDPDLNWTGVVDDFTTDIMGTAGPVVKSVLTGMARYQHATLVMKKLTKYMSGEDEIDEIGDQLGFQAQEIRVPFSDLRSWSEEQIYEFFDGDMNQVLLMAEQYERYQATLDSVRNQVPAKALPYFLEIYDGTQINALRCRHIWHLYQAVGKMRLNQVSPDPVWRDYMADYNAAVALTDQAMEVIQRREASYKYPLSWSIGGSLDPAQEEQNGTSFGYRYLHKTHLGFYWTRRNTLALQVLTGQGDPFTEGFYLRPAIALDGAALTVHFPDEANLSADLNFGDGTTGDANTPSHTYPGKGAWTVTADIRSSEGNQTYVQNVARVETQAYAGAQSLSITTPSNPLINLVLGGIFPRMQFGINEGSSSRFLAFGMDLNKDRLAESFTVTILSLADVGMAGYGTTPSDFNFILTYGAGSTLPVKARHMVLFGATVSGQMETPIHLAGGLDIESIINAAVLIGDGAFTEENARRLIADILGTTPDQLPETLEMEAEIAIEPY